MRNSDCGVRNDAQAAGDLPTRVARHSAVLSPRSPIAPRPAALAALILLTAFALSGCSNRHVNENYGGRGGFSANSINGTSVFGKLLEGAGHRVRSVASLYPRVGQADVIVWFVSDFNAPSSEAQIWLDDWLRFNEEGDGKTLIIVGRDFQAGEQYWSATMPRAPAEQQGEYGKRLRESKNNFQGWRSMPLENEDGGEWFTLDKKNTKRKVKSLKGPWAQGVDASKAQLEHRRFLTPGPDARPLLSDGRGHPLASEIVFEPEEWDWRTEDSRVVIVENGSFLLNAQLVNKEHRKLAGQLVDHMGDPSLDVAFLESAADPMVLESDPSTSPPTIFHLYGLWPISAVLAQTTALGIIFAMSLWPIFGTPRRSERPSLTDFGRHVAALGRLLAATRDRAYAYAQLRAYFQVDPKD